MAGVPCLLLALTTQVAALEPPRFSAERGIYDEPFTLELSAEAGATVLYGVGPGEPATPWVGPIQLDGTAIVRAVAVGEDGEVSAVATHTYLRVDQVIASAVMDPGVAADPIYGPTLDRTLRELPTISLVLDGETSTTEQRVSLEWVDPAGESVQLDCGLRAVGGHSLGYEKNNLRLNFRGEYGEGKLHLDLYGEAPFNTGVPPADEHDALNLRGGSHDSVFYLGSRGQYLRNQWMDETQLEMGHIAPHNRWAHVYLDAEYIGIYHVRERFDAGFMAGYLGGDEDDYEAINAGAAVDGDGSAWAQLLAARGDYEATLPWLNVENFLDYMLLNFYAANDWDWNPNQNWMAAGPEEAGEGGFIFHSSDSDICLYYDWDYSLLHEPGPDYIFQYLMEESHPDFRALLVDRIFLAFEEEGPLSAEAAGERYRALAERLEETVVAESARWGQGWWDRDDEWADERAWLLETWFPRRTGAQLEQLREAGWYVLAAPEVSTAPGVVAASTAVQLAAPEAYPEAGVWLRTDGGDPRLPGGALAPEAVGGGDREVVSIDAGTWLSGRLRQGETWGPLRRGLYELDAPPPVVLNEWNAVDEGRLLDEEDAALGRLPGNGGDWLELVVIQDHLDLRGWSLEMSDRGGEAGALRFTDHEVLADLRSGTILTIAEELPQDLAYDPEGGDWRFHLRAGEGGDGAAISAAPFDVSHREWQLTVYDAGGKVAFGPVGEGEAPADGISGGEVGLLKDTPGEHTRRWDAAYDDSDSSTFGAPNVWSGGEQDLSTLRAVIEPPAAVDSGVDSDPPPGGDTEADSGIRPDSGDSAPPAEPGAPSAAAPGGCGCGGGGLPPGGGLLALLGPLLLLRRARWLPLLGVVACGGSQAPAPPPQGDSAPPADSGDSAAPIDSGAPAGDSAPPLDCFLDGDGDGWGDAPADCEAGVSLGGDCDDGDPAVSPEAPETCDGEDQDCDGVIDEEPVDGLPFYEDADGDGWGGAALTTACALGDGAALVDGDCDEGDPEIHPGAEEACDGVDQDCDGSSEDGRGVSEDCPAASCLELYEAGDTEDGAYWLELPTGSLAQVYCDQSRDGGGWTLGFARNTASTGSQGDFGAGEVELGGLAMSDEEASASAAPQLAWQDLNLLEWSELRLTAAYSGARTYASPAIDRASLRLSFGEDGYLLYGEEGYWWCGGDASYTDGGEGAVDNPPGAPAGCRGHGSLGSGWDFSASEAVNQGLTLCGGDGSNFLSATWGGTWVSYGSVGGAQAIWVR